MDVSPLLFFCGLLIIIVAIMVWAWFNTSWQKTAKTIPKEFHRFPTWLIWLTCIPIVNLVILWMLLPFSLPQAIQKYQPDNAQLQEARKGLFAIGLTYVILLTASIALQFIPIVGILLNIATLVVFIVYWVVIIKIRTLLNRTTCQTDTPIDSAVADGCI